jgi:uncharacterized protein (DUF1499 family)
MKFEIAFMMITMIIASVLSCSGKIPSNLGVKDGKLAPCPNSPNCVSSQTDDPLHKIEPITYKSGRAQAHAILVDVIKNLKRTKIVAEKEDYIYAEFTSAMFRFVDDVEFYFDNSKNVIHVRSASRLGYSDMGVNRKRIEQIRKLFAEMDQNLK